MKNLFKALIFVMVLSCLDTSKYLFAQEPPQNNKFEQVPFSFFEYVPNLTAPVGKQLHYIKIINQKQFDQYFGKTQRKKIDWNHQHLMTFYSSLENIDESEERIRVVSIKKYKDESGKEIYEYSIKINEVYEPLAGEGLSEVLPKTYIPQVTIAVNAKADSESQVKIKLLSQNKE